MHFSVSPTIATETLLKIFADFDSDVPIHREPIYSFKKRKIHLFSQWDDHLVEYFYASDHAYIIEDGILEQYDFVREALNNNNDLCLVLTTKTAYQEDIVGALVNFLKSKSYSDGLIETCMSVIQELIMNATIHGNLGLNINLNQDISRADQALLLQETFSTIHKKLEQPEFGKRPVLVRLNCYDETILVDVQDQGAGFDFEAFKEKYKNTKIQKGMDLIFLMSKDMEYNRDTKTMSVVLEDPDKAVLSEFDVDFSTLRIGVCADSKNRFKVMQSVLFHAAFEHVVYIPHDVSDAKKLLSEIDIVIMLSDLSPEDMLSFVKNVRSIVSNLDMPILCQKSSKMDYQDQKFLGEQVNDFMSEKVHVYEIVARIKAQYSMCQAKNEIVSFVKNYQSEILQSQNTIEYLEKIVAVPLQCNRSGNCFKSQIQGTQTKLKNVDGVELLEEKIKVPYGHGFSFELDGRNFFFFISMRYGLSSVLVLSYLKGFIEKLKVDNSYLNPSEIIVRVTDYISEVVPDMTAFKLICSTWDPDQGGFIFDHMGAFLPVEFQKQSKTPLIYKGNISVSADTKDKIYHMNDNSAFCIFDADIRVNMNDLAAFLNEKISNDVSTQESFIDSNGTEIPFFLTYSCVEGEDEV